MLTHMIEASTSANVVHRVLRVWFGLSNFQLTLIVDRWY